MNENLIDLFCEEEPIEIKTPVLFGYDGVVSERKPISDELNTYFSKANSETQTIDENFLEITPDDTMHNRIVLIEPTPYTVTQGFFTSYKLYTILSKKTKEFNYEFKVNRRFSDFEWLYQTLISKYPGYIIPELPEKNFLASMNFEKSEFIEARRKDLEDFVMKLLEHKHLRNVEELKAFIMDDEKQFSIVKGKSDLKLKGFSINFTKEVIGYLAKKNTSFLKRQYDEDKDLQNHKVFFVNMKQIAENLEQNIEFLMELRQTDLKSLANFELFSSELITNEYFCQVMHDFNETKLNISQMFLSNIENKISTPLKIWLKNTMDVIAALKRREILDNEVFEDLMKIDEMRRNNIKTNNKRDMEMDILQTRLDVNQKLLVKTTKTLLCEINEFKKNSEQDIKTILRNFNEVHDDFYIKGGFIY